MSRQVCRWSTRWTKISGLWSTSTWATRRRWRRRRKQWRNKDRRGGRVRYNRPMRALVPLVLLMSTACASILRSSKHDVTIYGPEDLKVYDGARPVDLVREGVEGGQVKYSAAVDRRTASLTLASQENRAEVPLTDSPA